MIDERDFQQLSAYLDNELSEQERRAIEQRLSQEAALRDCLETLRQENQWLKHTFASIADEPVPDDLSQLILAKDESRHTPSNASVHRLQPRNRVKPYWTSGLAACLILIIGFMIGQTQGHREGQAPDTHIAVNQQMQPSVALIDALDHDVSGTDKRVHDGRIKMELSFFRHDGSLCRQYLSQQNGRAFHGIACRESGVWQNTVLSPLTNHTEERDHYRLAGPNQESAISSYISTTINGIPLSVEEEHDLLR